MLEAAVVSRLFLPDEILALKYFRMHFYTREVVICCLLLSKYRRNIHYIDSFFTTQVFILCTALLPLDFFWTYVCKRDLCLLRINYEYFHLLDCKNKGLSIIGW
jgi:hypothetical protein